MPRSSYVFMCALITIPSVNFQFQNIQIERPPKHARIYRKNNNNSINNNHDYAQRSAQREAQEKINNNWETKGL